jgi:diguanylate cyclase (GGDEF)-like protein
VRLPGAGRLVRGSIADITERKQSQDRIRHMAHHDALTGLPNRTLFQDRVTQAIAQAHRRRAQVAVLFVDLDRFKDVNDSLGHETGDRLLGLAGGRLQACLREGDTVARLGGDEFVISLPAVSDSNDAMLVAGKVLEALRESFVVDGHELHISSSVGISLYPADGDDTEALMRAADTAMYHAKERGRDNYQFFMPALNEAAQRRQATARRLQQAVPLGEFVLHYQPLVSLETGRAFAAEALVRWRQADGSLILPGEFVKIAEETGVIVTLGEWVLREALHQLAKWQEAGRPELRLAVNLSPRQLRRPGFPEMVAEALREAGVSAEALQLEITEGMLMAQSGVVLEVLGEVAELAGGLDRLNGLLALRPFELGELGLEGGALLGGQVVGSRLSHRDGTLVAGLGSCSQDTGDQGGVQVATATPADVRQSMRKSQTLAEDLRAALNSSTGSSKSVIEELRRIVDRAGSNIDPLPLARRAGGIPVINRVAAGYPAEFTDLDYPASVADEYITCPDVSDPQAFAARVVGDSMEPEYHEGDIVVFSPMLDTPVGSDCFVRLERDNETTFKRVYFEEDGRTIRLQPLNNAYAPRFVDREDVSGLWAAVYVMRRVERMRV